MRHASPALRAPLLVAALVALWGCGAQAPSRPSLALLITVDTLRADRLGAYGSERGLTPELDALARQSLVFGAAYAPASFTVPSVAALMTGRYPEELGIWKNESGLPPEVETLAGALRRRGWRTAAVVSNFVLREASGLGAGFERYDDRLPQQELVRRWPERTASGTTDAAIAMLDGCATGPGSRCFLWVHYQDPHGPYTPPPALRRRFLPAQRRASDGRRELPVQPGPIGLGGIPRYQLVPQSREVAFYRAGYDAEVHHMDAQLGRLLDALRARGVADGAVVAFAADHGESLGEDDYWFAHGEYLSEPLVRVPLILKVPGREPGRRDDLVSLVDLHATLLRLLTGEPADSLRGRDLLAPGAAGEASPVYLATLGASTRPRFGLIDGDWKLVVAPGGEANGVRLSRRGEDAEVRDPARARALRERLEALRAGLERMPETRPTLSESDRESLRALGYLDAGERR